MDDTILFEKTFVSQSGLEKVRVAAVKWNGKVGFDVREFYVKNGEWALGKGFRTYDLVTLIAVHGLIGELIEFAKSLK